MPSYEFAGFVDSLPEDLHGFNEFLQSLSAEERRAFDARLAAPAAESETGPGTTGAFFGELGFQGLDFGLGLIPLIGQGKAAGELATGKNIRGEELGWLGRAWASIDLIPFGKLAKKAAEGVVAAGKGAVEAAGAVAKLGRKADDVAGAGKFAAPKAAIALAADAVERHHQLPRQFAKRFKAAGLDIEDFVIPLDKARHRLTPNGLHTTGGGNWNKVWKEFFDSFGGGPGPTRDQILSQLSKMRKDFGLE